MEAKLEKITPEMARQYLEHNTANYRTLSARTVHTYAEDMRNGNWAVNGEPVVFDKTGTLKDGQHRLNAIIESGKTIPMLVVRGIDTKVDTYDCGRGRTIQQWGHANNLSIPTTVSSAARIIICGFRGNAPRGTQKDYIQQHYDELKEAARIAGTGKKDGIGNKGAVCLCVYICRRFQILHDDVLENFFRIFNTGTFGKEQQRDPSPALVAARQFLTKLPSGSAAAQIRHFEVIMQALQDFKKNKNRKRDYPYDAQQLEWLKEIQKADSFQTNVN